MGNEPCTRDSKCSATSHYGDCKSMPFVPIGLDDYISIDGLDGWEVWLNKPNTPRLALFAHEEDAELFIRARCCHALELRQPIRPPTGSAKDTGEAGKELSSPKALSLAEDENEVDDSFDDWKTDPDRICVGCGKREAILNHCCAMCTELHPERM